MSPDIIGLAMRSGTGMLLIDSRERGEAAYEFDLPGPTEMRLSGRIVADPMALRLAAEARSVTLRLNDGRELEVTVTRRERDCAEVIITQPLSIHPASD